MAPYDRFYLTTESETEQEADAERGKYRLRRVVADVLLAAVLKAADVTARIIPNPFRVAAIFIGHCARGKVEIFHRFGGVGRATLWFCSGLRRNRGALVNLVFTAIYFLIDDLFYWPLHA